MENLLQILVFRTTIKTQEDKEKIAPLLVSMPQIYRWTVDCEDCDCVLRIEAEGISEEQIIETVQRAGFECEELKD
ncbi:hypothetical protein [Runella sp.]|jgi:hypothetical protein|uniref:hypothetical protein n=1 Tax=Runella sp. TaxID=1960881 RepID=UPI00261E7CCC|nr:hypothetical protein [Runella sp.]